jgi:membrane-associated protein
MNYLRFVLYNIAGGVLWVMSMTLAGYFVGSIIPKITEYLDLVIAVVIVTSVLPSILLWVLRRRPTRRIGP